MTKRLPDHHAAIRCTGRTSLLMRLQTVRHLRDKNVSTLTCSWLSTNCRRWTVSAHQFIYEMLQLLCCWPPSTSPVILRSSRLSCSFCATRRHAHKILFQFINSFKQLVCFCSFFQSLKQNLTFARRHQREIQLTRSAATDEMTAKTFFIQPWRSFHELKGTGCNFFMYHTMRIYTTASVSELMWPPAQKCYFLHQF